MKAISTGSIQSQEETLAMNESGTRAIFGFATILLDTGNSAQC